MQLMCTAHCCTQGASCHFMCLSVCPEFGFLLSSFASHSLTHPLTYRQRFNKKSGKVPTRDIAQYENDFSTFCSPIFCLGSYLILDDLSHNYQIKRKSKRHSFPKNQNRPKFWMLSVIRMSFSRRKIKRFLQFHTQASQRSISDLKSYALTYSAF